MQFATHSALVVLGVVAALAAGVVAQDAFAAQPDTLLYTVESGDTLIKICSKHRAATNHYALSDLLADIRRANGLDSNFLRIGQSLRIPVVGDDGVERAIDRVQDGAELRGIYLTGPACGVSSVLQRVDRFVAAGGNAVVFDAKDIDGALTYFSGHALADWGAGRSAPLISSLGDMLARFQRRGLYVVARVAVFLDGSLGARRPDLALQSPTGGAWRERDCTWLDPAQPEVREYNLALAGELARAGVDEIQFDYVRFPTNGWQGDRPDSATGVAADDLDRTAQSRRQLILAFLSAARDTLTAYDVKISADLFGIMAWNRMEDLALTGQDVTAIAELVDVICPMIYPSHFRPGFEGRKRPGDDPEYFISEGTRRFVEMAAGRAEVRPWLQSFAWRVTGFDGQYIAAQVSAARNAGGHGWSLWNPACRYNAALSVLPGLCDPAPLVSVVGPMSSVDTPRPPAEDGDTAVAAHLVQGVLVPVEDPFD